MEEIGGGAVAMVGEIETSGRGWEGGNTGDDGDAAAAAIATPRSCDGSELLSVRRVEAVSPAPRRQES